LDSVSFTFGRDGMQRIIEEIELAGAYGLKDVKEYIINRLVAAVGC